MGNPIIPQGIPCGVRADRVLGKARSRRKNQVQAGAYFCSRRGPSAWAPRCFCSGIINLTMQGNRLRDLAIVKRFEHDPSLHDSVVVSYIMRPMLANILHNVVTRVAGWLIAGFCVDLLGNWSGTKDKLSEIYPVLGIFLPHLAFAVLMTFLSFQIPFAIRLYRKIKKWRRETSPEGRFHAELSELSRLSEGIRSDAKNLPFGFMEISPYENDTMRRIGIICARYDIPFPPVREVGSPFLGMNEWVIFCDRLIHCAELRDLKWARNILAEMESRKT